MRGTPMLMIAAAATLAGGMLCKPFVRPQGRAALDVAAAAPSVRVPDRRVSIHTELVTATTVAAARRVSPPAVAKPRARQVPTAKRSLFARVLLGDGETRPQPFPRPGS